MSNLIVNSWHESMGVMRSSILKHQECPEGLDFERIRMPAGSNYAPSKDCGTLMSVLAGEGRLSCRDGDFFLERGVHAYFPPDSNLRVDCGDTPLELVFALSPERERARGKKTLLRSEKFVQGCASPEQSLRWILTAQYLSRRIFLYHDETLLSPQGEPLSWFHTTMFDVEGLPPNEEGESVFKMSYNHRSEPNICYEVRGDTSFRSAEHPYLPSGAGQKWGDWQALSGESTYHLDEAVAIDGKRNKHEIRILGGYVSLMCMHCPGATGAERHSEGEYSEYGALSDVVGSESYSRYLQQIEAFDAMVDRLSQSYSTALLVSEKDQVETELAKLPEWKLYSQGLKEQKAREQELYNELCRAGQGRELAVDRWRV